MSSRFNELYRGEPEDAAGCLDSGATPDELRLALINVLHRIDRLQKQVMQMTRVPDEGYNHNNELYGRAIGEAMVRAIRDAGPLATNDWAAMGRQLHLCLRQLGYKIVPITIGEG